MNEEEYEGYFRWRELEEDWTIEVDENNKPFSRHVNGGACFADFDYNVQDGKTYYCENDSFNQKIEKKRETAKYYIVSVSDQRQLMNDLGISKSYCYKIITFICMMHMRS